MAKMPDRIIIQAEDRLSETLALLTEVFGMNADNSAAIVSGEIPRYSKYAFDQKAEKIRKLVEVSETPRSICSNDVCNYCTGEWCQGERQRLPGCFDEQHVNFTGRSLIVPEK